MVDKDKSRMKEWISRWEKTGRVLEKIKREEMTRINTPQSIELLNDAFESALWLHQWVPSSGLIEQQRLFMKVKR